MTNTHTEPTTANTSNTKCTFAPIGGEFRVRFAGIHVGNGSDTSQAEAQAAIVTQMFEAWAAKGVTEVNADTVEQAWEAAHGVVWFNRVTEG